MKKIIILFFSVVFSACGGGGDTDPAQPNIDYGCTANFDIYQLPATQAVHDDNDNGIFNIEGNHAYLLGVLNGSDYSVIWQNRTTVDTGVASTYTYSYLSCVPIFGCTTITKTSWNSDILINLGDNDVTIYITDENGYEQCKDITVTHLLTHTPKVMAVNAEQTATDQVEVSGSFEDGGLTPVITIDYDRDENFTSYKSIAASHSSIGEHKTEGNGVVTGFLPGVTYYFRIQISNDEGVAISDSVPIDIAVIDATQALPEISPYWTPTTITSNSAVVGAWVLRNGADYTAFVEFSDNPDFSNYRESSKITRTINLTGWISESWSLKDLTPNTTYYYRYVVYNTGGTVITDPQSFTTLP